jgi:hypothetical protein
MKIFQYLAAAGFFPSNSSSLLAVEKTGMPAELLRDRICDSSSCHEDQQVCDSDEEGDSAGGVQGDDRKQALIFTIQMIANLIWIDYILAKVPIR